jgi:hypothetical protein
MVLPSKYQYFWGYGSAAIWRGSVAKNGTRRRIMSDDKDGNSQERRLRKEKENNKMITYSDLTENRRVVRLFWVVLLLHLIGGVLIVGAL